LESTFSDPGRLRKRGQSPSLAAGILPLLSTTLLDAELHQRSGCRRLLLKVRGKELPHELRCRQLPVYMACVYEIEI
jgi:hypothetical protein